MLHPDQDVRTLNPVELGLIEREHAHLQRFLCDLRDTCCEFESGRNCDGCEHEKTVSCQGRMASFCYDFMDLVDEHFDNEEQFMRAGLASPEDDDDFLRHLQAHSRLTQEMRKSVLQALTLSKQGDTAAAVRLLYDEISRMFGEHARAYDRTFTPDV